MFLTKPKKPPKPRNAPGMGDPQKEEHRMAFGTYRIAEEQEYACDVEIRPVDGGNGPVRSGGNSIQASPSEEGRGKKNEKCRLPRKPTRLRIRRIMHLNHGWTFP